MRLIVLLFLFIFPFTLSAQETVLIKGKVVAEDGSPLPGASVYADKSTIGEKSSVEGVVVNYNLGTTTDVNGTFSVAVPKGNTKLICSFIGYETQVIKIQNKPFINITMKESEGKLGEVVVTGYQKIEKRKLTSAVSTIKAANILQAGVSSVDMMLSGQVAGVQTTAVNGAPGAPAKIRIRGTVSLSGTQDPLWVLDGMPLEGTNLPDMSDKNIDQLFSSSIAGINPADIEDITILKDAAATAIYGARAANGVILITTKKGKEGKPTVQFSSKLSFTAKPNMSKLNLMNSSEKIDLELQLAKYNDLDSDNSITKKGAIARLFDSNSLWDQYRNGGVESLPSNVQTEIANLRSVNTNWGDELYRTAANQDYSLSINGGSEKASYYFSTGYYNELGTTKGTSLNRLNFTLKGNYKLASNLKVGATIFANERKQGSYLTGTGLITNPSRYSRSANPYQKIYDDNGNYVYDPEIPTYSGTTINYNIIEERNNTSNNLKARTMNAIFDADWEILPKLNLRSQLGLQRDNQNLQQFGGKNSYFSRRERAMSRVGDSYFVPEGGVIKNTESTLSQWNLKTVLEYRMTLAEKHEFDFMAGNELRRTKQEDIFSAGYGFNEETLTTQPVIFPDQSYSSTFPLFKKSYVENAYASFFGTLGYTYNNKYTFFGSVRMDGSDLFGVDPKYKYLPLWAASGAWRVKEESFLKNVKWINDLKLRLSYGLQGNIDKGTSKYIVGDRKTATLLPGQTESTITPTNLPNDRLRWEKTATWNAGFDIAVLDNRIYFSADAYHRKSTDLIGMRTVALENGLGTATINWAGVTNKGLELSLVTKNINTSDFKWSTTINVAKNINNVDNIEIPSNQITPSLKGYPVNALFAFKTAGLDEQGYPLFQKGDKKVTATEFFGLVDPEGWGMYQSTLSNEQIRDLYTYVGSKDPKISGGFINNIELGRFSLNISCSFNLGQWIKTEPFYDMVEMDRGINRSTMMNKVWTPDNKSGIYPRMIGPNTEDGNRLGDYMAFNTGYVLATNVFRDLDIWYKKINYLRVNSIRFGYEIPKNLLTKVGISYAKVNLEAQNPFVIASNYEGYFDPETLGNIYAQPMPKSITVGLNVTF
ncbi:SusC/RagA family TonB-linked outer membrane protein [uncultured Bacteroides sp.]|uniref:SusC/RagA family TonB-linked outer membrane protein n=1 Tax=uncultured Bacteroides sp. TaxID=162156 RepID=UPI002AAA681F|nr:SusC/RagA family TonB-linked outer membrane protein [uncultured Bacteroides sp.]